MGAARNSRSAENPPGLRVVHRCPRCAGPAVLEETEYLLRCAYCRVTSCLLPGDAPRYLLGAVEGGLAGGGLAGGGSASAGSLESVLWFPYWRLRGTLFTMRAGTAVHHRHIDTHLPALAAPGFPATLGVRPQAMPLHIIAAETPGRFVQPGISAGEAARVIARRFAPSGETTACDFIGERMSLVYAPYGVGTPGTPRALVDLISGRPTGAILDEEEESTLPIDRTPPPGASFVPATCPLCATDLDGGSHALVFACAPCGTRWFAGPRGLEPLPWSMLGDDATAAVLIPFWRFAGDGIDYWSPAIKLRPPVFLRVAATMTLAQPGRSPRVATIEGGTRAPDSARVAVPLVLPVTLSREEAADGAPWVFAAIRYVPPALSHSLDALRHAPPVAAGARLVYVSFADDPLQYVNHALELAIERSAVSMGTEM